MVLLLGDLLCYFSRGCTCFLWLLLVIFGSFLALLKVLWIIWINFSRLLDANPREGEGVTGSVGVCLGGWLVIFFLWLVGCYLLYTHILPIIYYIYTFTVYIYICIVHIYIYICTVYIYIYVLFGFG